MSAAEERSSPQGPVLLVRAAGGEDGDAEALRERGIEVLEDPYLVVRTCVDTGARARADAVVAALRDEVGLFLLTSRAAVRALQDLVGSQGLRDAVAVGVARGLRGAAVGPRTAAALRELGLTDVLEPEVPTSRGLLAALRARAEAETEGGTEVATGGGAGSGAEAGSPPSRSGPHGHSTGAVRRAVLPCGAQAMKGLGEGLVADGWHIDEIVVYTTDEIEPAPSSVSEVAAGRIPVIVLRSPTAVRAVARHVPRLPADTVLVCGGPTTAAAVRAVWGSEPVVSPGPTADAVAAAVAAVLAGTDRA